jgi:hypothetical protein
MPSILSYGSGGILMSIKLPADPQERIRAMVNLARGNSVTYSVEGKRVTVTPRQTKDQPATGKDEPQEPRQ